MPMCTPCKDAADYGRMELHGGCENRGEDRSHCFCQHHQLDGSRVSGGPAVQEETEQK